MNKKKGISADVLKIYSLVILAISILGSGFILRHFQSFHIQDLLRHGTVLDIAMEMSSVTGYAMLSKCVSLIGSLAVPVYAFLMIEGYLYTDSVKWHVLKIVIYSIVMEVPFAFYLTHKPWTYEAHNPMVAILISLIMVWVLNFVHQHIRGIIVRVWAYVLVVTVATFISVVSLVNNGVNGNIGTYIVLVSAAMYLFYNKPVVWRIIVIILSLLLSFYLAPLSLILLYFYDGTRKDIINKYVYYAAYPVLLIIGAFI